MSDWQPIETAPKDGTRFRGRCVSWIGRDGTFRQTMRVLVRKTWWGKTSHVPLYGWCHGRDVENVDLWQPTHWKPYAPEV